MNVVGKVGSIISQGVYSVATPFHPFGGAVDIIVVEQKDGTYRGTPWYVRFGKFQGVLKGAEKIVGISVNGVDAGFHMYLDNSGEAYFVREVSDHNTENHSGPVNIDILEVVQDGNDNSVRNHQNENGVSIDDGTKVSEECVSLSMDQTNSGKVNNEQLLFGYHDGKTSQVTVESQGYYRYGSVDQGGDFVKAQGSDSEVVLVSVDGHVLTAPISSFKENTDNVQLSTPQFHLGPSDGTQETIEQTHDSSNGDFGPFGTGEDAWAASLFGDIEESIYNSSSGGVLPIGGDGTSNFSSDVCKEVGQHAVLLQETPNVDKLGNDLVINCSSEDSNSCSSRQERSESYLDPSDLTSHAEDDVLGDTLSLSVGSPGNAGTPSFLSSVEGASARGDLKVSNGARAPLPYSESPCECGSLVEGMHMEALESTASFNKNVDSLGSENISVCNDSELKDEQLGAAQQSQQHESSQPMVTDEECNKNLESQTEVSDEEIKSGAAMGFEISLCANLLHPGMGWGPANEVFNAHRLSEEQYRVSGPSIIKNEKLIVRYKDTYMTWEKAAPIILGMVAFGLDFPAEPKEAIPVGQNETPKGGDNNTGPSSTPSRIWRLWPIPFRRTKTLQHSNSNASSADADVFVDSESCFSPSVEPLLTRNGENGSLQKKFLRTNVPTSEQIASLNLKDGQNLIAFSFSTRVLGKQQVDAHIYLWKWNAKIVISDVDGTITKSDVLGQFMPLVGKDWTQSGVARLFSAIKENGYQLLFLSARAIVQAYLTRSFLLNLKQDGKALPNGPVVISPDGLFPSLYREVIRRAPHEFKIACLEDIRALFPSDYNPFYAGFGNRDTDELSYRKIGIPKGKIFIINPKGEVAINHCTDVRSYTSLHKLVNDMFPPTSLAEQEDFNSWNYWKLPFPDIDF
ncbi:phosphatidate phosphatase PAH1-like protein isoform X1 [Cinnamomum micranthum f. kanehirae]|uniref:phosphatidate phosphatase n=1 Tax=Cinnamomum micranthum f. kanehirae TaxID=337451 RepID=A0A443NEE8_9MAGN|nr:phosphatidate phosphatase PAH1-like protein isoform X1 [Cinnamomum micranthum f. kanehirae]